MRKECGFILLMTLLLTGIMSALLLGASEHLLLYYKSINRQAEHEKLFYKLERIAIDISFKAIKSANSPCEVTDCGVNHSLQILQSAGCHVSKGIYSYAYLIEDLGVHPCLITHVNHKKYATHHKRITVGLVKENHIDSIIQLRIIVPVKEHQTCFDNQRHVFSGISSWRYLNNQEEF